MNMITERDLDAHVNWLQSPRQRGGWSPSRDLMLAELLGTGRGIERAADALGVGVAEARACWDALFPAEARGVTLQPVLLRILRRNAEAARLRVVG